LKKQKKKRSWITLRSLKINSYIR